TAAVAISLLAGIVASTIFALRADARGRDLRRTLDQTEGMLARSLLKPLDINPAHHHLPTPEGESLWELAAPEGESLWELATLESETVWLRTLDEATRDPLPTSQLLARSEPALIASVSLDPRRRDRALGLLTSRMRDPSLPLTHRAEIAWLALDLEGQQGPNVEACVAVIREV